MVISITNDHVIHIFWGFNSYFDDAVPWRLRIGFEQVQER
jgi:hypothetical protein